MNDKQTDPTPEPGKPLIRGDGEVTPDSLLGDFRGRPLGKIILFTLIVHLVFVSIFSLGYMRELVLGKGGADMELAVREATAALREIADRHEVDVQELGKQFAGNRPTAAPATPEEPAAPAEQPTDATPAAPAEPDEPAKGLSEIEKALQVQEVGPQTPDLSADHEEDLFGPKTP